MIFTLNFLFGLAMISFVYLLSNLFSKSGIAFKLIPLISLGLGLFLPGILKMIVFNYLGCLSFHILEYLFFIIPIVPYWHCFYKMIMDSFPGIGFFEDSFALGEEKADKEQAESCPSQTFTTWEYSIFLILGFAINFALNMWIDSRSVNETEIKNSKLGKKMHLGD